MIMSKKVLIIDGHPDAKSFNNGLFYAYQNGASKSSVELQSIIIRDLDFNPNLKYGYRKRTELEPDLSEAIEKIKWSDHMVWIHPVWWYSIPALMKGFIDRTFLPGITFQYQNGSALPKKLLKGKTARIISTADSPKWYYDWVMKGPATHHLKRGTLEFCGVKPVKTTYIGPVKDSTDEFRRKWIEKVNRMGEALK